MRKRQKRSSLLLVFPLLLFMAGCAHIISDSSLDRADRSITFQQLRNNPDAYRGKFIILGGAVIDVSRIQAGVQLEVMEYPVDSEEMPETTSEPEGRFLVVLPRDVSATFKQGMWVSLAGEVAGTAVKKLDGRDYPYPVLVVKEIHIIVRPAGRPYNYGGY